MYSVTQRTRTYKQPYGGYLPIKDFEVIKLKSESNLLEEESIDSSLVGIVVDYLTRVTSGTPVKDAFRVSIVGAAIIGEYEKASKISNNIVGLDDTSIISACKLAGYDCVVRAGAHTYKNVDYINPSAIDINNIKVMVERSLTFFDEYGPIVKDGITFEGGYTNIITSGDGDFITKDTLWDFKVSANKPTSKHSLQILVYYIMGKHSVNSNDYKGLKYLAFYNPRLNTIYRFPISKIPSNVIEEVSKDVIGYRLGEANNKSKNEKSYLTVKDIASRYGVSESKVRGDCFTLGMPHRKQGNKYIIDELDLIKWEYEQVYIPVGKTEKRLLPGYLAALALLNKQLAEAKEIGDKDKIKILKKKISIQKRRDPNYRNPITGYVIISMLIVVLILVIWFGIWFLNH